MGIARARLLASHAELDAHAQREWTESMDVTPISQVSARTRVRVAGVLRAVSYAPKTSTTALRAELFDGTSSLDLVWTGRREVLGIVPGRRLVASGMIAASDGGRPRLVMYNPRYELLPTGVHL